MIELKPQSHLQKHLSIVSIIAGFIISYFALRTTGIDAPPLLLGASLFFPGLIGYFWTKIKKMQFSVYETDLGNIFVARNEGHNEIVEEMMKRRKLQLLARYGSINF